MTVLIILICLGAATILGTMIYLLIRACANPQKSTPHYLYANGMITAIQDKGLNNPTVVVIQYTVKNQTFELKETLKLKSEDVKVGNVTVGQKKVPVTKAERGQMVIIAYDAKDPAKAFWVANHGHVNV
ncbi:MAG: hypothetical protein IJZ68_06360 [Bacteroidaceae bacterium]|nr:hypothetical protein [Bacteroidaceae bacterium]